jgi:hypothetical protein
MSLDRSDPPEQRPAPPDLAFSDRRGLLEANLARQIEAIRASDAKIFLLVPTTTAMLGILAALLRIAHFTQGSALYVIFSTLPLITAYALMAIAIIPRFRGDPASSLLFFGGLADRPPAEARDALLTLDAPTYLADLAQQCHITATIARTKYRHVRNAYVAFLVALPFWATAIYLLTRPD